MVEGAPPEEKGIGVSTREDEKGRVERREEKQEEEIAELRSDASKESGAAIDDGLMGRAAKAKKLVDCMEGFTVEDPGVTCEVACDGDCCVGEDSCKGFTGSVAKDGSCNERRACYKAEIGVVSGGSCDGPNACSYAKIGVVSGKSCKGPSACNISKSDVVSGGSCIGE